MENSNSSSQTQAQLAYFWCWWAHYLVRQFIPFQGTADFCKQASYVQLYVTCLPVTSAQQGYT